MEQAELCHYRFANDESSVLHTVCLPTAVLVLERGNITELGEGNFGERFCTCKFRGGKRVCALGECNLLSWLQGKTLQTYNGHANIIINPSA